MSNWAEDMTRIPPADIRKNGTSLTRQRFEVLPASRGSFEYFFDIFGGLSRSNGHYAYIALVVDKYTLFPEAASARM